MEPVDPQSLPDALSYLLAAPGAARRADRRQVDGYIRYLEECGIAWEGLRAQAAGRMRAVYLALRLPGRTAIVLIAEPGRHGIEADTQEILLRAGLAAMEHDPPHFAQILLEPESRQCRPLVERCGFRFLTRLDYLQCAISRGSDERPESDRPVAWVRYGEAARHLFEHTLQQTYVDSLDCPELTDLRPIDDVIASHQAAGKFAAELWELATIDGKHAGCLLLSRVPQAAALEVVYVGVVPGWRGKGVGALLMQRALAHARRQRVPMLTLVVDRRNDPARRLYARFGMTPMTVRDAFLYRWNARVE